jgi:hypothetical protein
MNDLMRHRGEFARAIRNRKFEISPAGILFPQQGVLAAGVFDTEHRRGGDLIGRDISPNIIPTEGLNHILDAIVGGASQVDPWYVALFKGNVTPGATLTGASFAGTCTEATEYDETTRVAYVDAAAADGIMSNSASRAEFTMNAGITVYGGALLSASAKSDATAGTKCLAASKFSASRAVVDDDELAVKYTLTLTSS